MKQLLTLFGIFFTIFLVAQNSRLASGPMPAYQGMREVVLWLQTTTPAMVELTYVDDKQQEKTIAQNTTEAEYNCGKFFIKGLEPGVTYTYAISIGGKKQVLKYNTFKTQSLWQYRKDPPTFKIALGSCAYTNEAKYDRPGEAYGKGNGIYTEIEKQKPDAMLWLGDNIYLRSVDYDSDYGINARYTDFRAVTELQGLLQCTHHYAIWDDHDFGPNDADRSYALKYRTLEAFKRFWGNYNYGINGKPSIISTFVFNDVQFFMLDNRYNRTSNFRETGEKYILGEEQVQWLIDALTYSKATFKFVMVGGQFLNPVAVFENHSCYAEERQQIIDLIEAENIKNVVFLTGDRHRTELTKLELKNGNVLYDLTCSPLTSKAYAAKDEAHDLRVKGTLVEERNFGVLNFSGSLEARKLNMQIFDVNGKLKWEKELESQN